MYYCRASRPGPRRTAPKTFSRLGRVFGCTSHGRRAFIVYSPCTSRVYATVDARFDETFFAFRTTNPRVYGQDYTPSIQLEQQSPITCRIRQWPASSRDSKTLPFHVALHGTSTIFYSCPLPSRSSGCWILKLCGQRIRHQRGATFRHYRTRRSESALEGFLPSCKA